MPNQTEAPVPRLTPKGQATRERIVRAAADHIFEHGVGGTSIEDVRKAVGVSGSQMTHYFQDKRSLVRAVIAYQAESILEFHRAPELGQLDTFAALETWADMSVAGQMQRNCTGGCILGSLAGELAETDACFRDDLADGFDRWENLLSDGLRTMRDRGDLRPDADPDELALVLLAAHQGGLLLTQTKRDVAPLSAALTGALYYVRSFATAAPD
ncbi:MAG TPA: TetR family transcriptional regulator C-terminal domain-containing protein [Gaiellaceae bacterium]|nr:TetR family transcriptional regulator C-terminal domain-containing protein [Gaiellaceae bacterium]